MPIWERTYSWLWMWSRIWLWFSLRGSRSDSNTWWFSDLFVWFRFVQQMPKQNFLHWVRSCQARSGRVGCPEKSLILSCFLVYSWQREAAQDFCAPTAALGLWFCPWIASQIRSHCRIQWTCPKCVWDTSWDGFPYFISVSEAGNAWAEKLM